MKEGILIKINATTELLQPEFEKYRKDGKNMFVVDGFPRSMEILDHWNKVCMCILRCKLNIYQNSKNKYLRFGNNIIVNFMHNI